MSGRFSHTFDALQDENTSLRVQVTKLQQVIAVLAQENGDLRQTLHHHHSPSHSHSTHSHSHQSGDDRNDVGKSVGSVAVEEYDAVVAEAGEWERVAREAEAALQASQARGNELEGLVMDLKAAYEALCDKYEASLKVVAGTGSRGGGGGGADALLETLRERVVARGLVGDGGGDGDGGGRVEEKEGVGMERVEVEEMKRQMEMQNVMLERYRRQIEEMEASQSRSDDQPPSPSPATQHQHSAREEEEDRDDQDRVDEEKRQLVELLQETRAELHQLRTQREEWEHSILSQASQIQSQVQSDIRSHQPPPPSPPSPPSHQPPPPPSHQLDPPPPSHQLDPPPHGHHAKSEATRAMLARMDAATSSHAESDGDNAATPLPSRRERSVPPPRRRSQAQARLLSSRSQLRGRKFSPSQPRPTRIRSKRPIPIVDRREHTSQP